MYQASKNKEIPSYVKVYVKVWVKVWRRLNERRQTKTKKNRRLAVMEIDFKQRVKRNDAACVMNFCDGK